MVAMSSGIAHGMRVPAWQIGIGWKALLRQPAREGHRDNSHQKIAFRPRQRTDPCEAPGSEQRGLRPRSQFVAGSARNRIGFRALP
jgi:hypothetical protein